MNGKIDHTKYPISSNVRNPQGIEMPWLLVWEQVEIWYGDIKKRESAERLLQRLQNTFSLRTNAPNEANGASKNGLSVETIERILIDVETVLCETMAGRSKVERNVELDRYRICLNQLNKMGLLIADPSPSAKENVLKAGDAMCRWMEQDGDLEGSSVAFVHAMEREKLRQAWIDAKPSLY